MVQKTPTVLFVDDHKLLRHALAHLLAQQMEIHVLEASNGKEALDHLDKTQVDVMILDVEMPVMNGRDTYLHAKKILPRLKVIIYTYLTGVENLMFFIHHGVDGFIFKGDDEDFMKEAIQRVLKGEQYFPQSVMVQIKPQLKSIVDLSKKIKLSDGELKLLENLKNGKTSKSISIETGLTEKTVITYRERLLSKTQTTNTAELIAFAIRNGLIKL